MKNYKEDARKLLKKAVLSEPWKNPRGKERYALIVDEEIVGHIRKKVDLNKLTIGRIHETWRGRKVELVYDNECVGFLWA